MPLAPQELRTYFITTVTANRRRLFQVEQNANLFIEVHQDQRTKGRLQLHAFVIMPDHIHLLVTPAPEISLEKAMQFIKGAFSFRLKSKLDVWERSYNNRRPTSTTSTKTLSAQN
jgi:putative transposase